MRMKPKSTVHNPRALLFKRFTDLEQSFIKNVLYITRDGKKWIFSKDDFAFVEYSGVETGFELINAYNPDNPDEVKVFVYKNTKFYYTMDFALERGEWVQTTDTIKTSQTAPVLSGNSEQNGILVLEYDIPVSCPILRVDEIEVTADEYVSYSAEICITNHFNETAIYRGDVVYNGELTTAIPYAETVTDKDKYKANTIIAKFMVVEVE